MSYPCGYDLSLVVRLYQPGDEIRYWASMPGRLTSEHRAFHSSDNKGTTRVREDGTARIRMRTPRPYVSRATGKAVPRAVFVQRRRRGRHADEWASKVHSVMILTDSRVRRLERVLFVTHGLFVNQHDRADRFRVASDVKEAAKMQRSGVVEVLVRAL